jgi:hypothetical protein
MGMYTEIKVECDVRADDDALTALQIMFGDADERTVDLKALAFNLHHRLFLCDRWTCIGRMSSAYFDTSREAVSSLEPVGDGVWRIRSISNLKNYDGEIGHFFDWLRPMVVGEPGQVIGHSWYEEAQYDEEPTPVTL